ncbi:Predicted arabinose efflux permease, MFS family [Chitinophaga eiseniae]|uniref:Predicted arabinose efflux permease, MFS family n=1 Tax=Chitinophaga eiseniae TaxID=634771 RepID=A0A1T4SSX6_9BACT|nr:MFS transporter [Chitinophaga eiseniae]SKA31252.1 Predicted arabinose efflux permease, MFS family [Chitinophaga eiseniae]
MIAKITQTYRSSFSGLSRETWLLSLVILINRTGTMVAPFLSIYLTKNLHRDIADAGLIITLFGVGAVLGSLASGYFIDKLGFRAVQIFTSIAGGGLFIAFGYITYFPALCVMTVILSFVAEAFRPANGAAIAAYSKPENLTRSYSLNRFAMNLGWALGSSLGGILAAINYHLLFWVEGGVYITVGLLIFFLLPTYKGAPRKSAVSGIARDLPIWKDPFLFRFLIWVTVYTASFGLIFRLVPIYWKDDWHINESVIGLLLGVNGVIIALFEMVLVRRWESRKSSMYYIIGGVVVTAAGYLFFIVPPVVPIVLAFMGVVFFTVGEMMAFPFINAVIMGRSNDTNRGRYAAAYALTWSVAQVVGPGGGALVAERWGFGMLWSILVVVCIICAVGLWRLSLKKAVAA